MKVSHGTHSARRRVEVLYFLRYGQHGYGDGRRVRSSLCLSLRYALYPMHAGLKLEAAEHTPACDTGA
jgi:hypothetical protein